MCAVYDQNALSEGMAQRCLCHFRSGDFDVKIASFSGQPFAENMDELTMKVE